ncbi:MAG: glycosyltransferase [Lentisphaeria bacterium]|nr:glycosyltransferase [Lentisphaeria bacterium]
MKDQPLVSVGVSAYNRKDLLRLCLASLLAQSYQNCEIIVVDDGSTDGTNEMMAAEFPQIRYIRQENAGDAAAKNHAAREASGKYIVFNDSDDLFLPQAVEKLVAALPDDDDNAVSYGTYQTIDIAGNTLPTKRKAAEFPSGRITGSLLRHILVNSTATLIPRKLFLDNGGFDSSLRVSHDYDFFLRISLASRFFAVQEPVFLRRRHGGNLSAGSYDKIRVVHDVLERFIAGNQEKLRPFAGIIRKRRADIHHKLCREAGKEKRYKEAREHALQAFKLSPGIKNFCALAKAMLKY